MSDEHVAYIKNERVTLTKEPPTRQPGLRESMDTALDRLAEKRQHGSAESNREPPRRAEGDALSFLAAERAEAKASAEREAEQQRQREAQQADQHIEQASQWHPDDEHTLGQLKYDVEDFEQAKNQLAQAQRFAKEHPDRISAQQRQDLQQANERLLQRQQELQQAGAKVQQAATIKSAEAARRKLYAEFPELADSDTRDRLVAWAQKRGIPKDVTLAETRPEVVGAALKQMQSEEKQKRERQLNRPRKPVETRGALAPGGETPHTMTVQEAREQLRKSGRTGDALNYLTLRREREQEAENG